MENEDGLTIRCIGNKMEPIVFCGCEKCNKLEVKE